MRRQPAIRTFSRLLLAGIPALAMAACETDGTNKPLTQAPAATARAATVYTPPADLVQKAEAGDVNAQTNLGLNYVLNSLSAGDRKNAYQAEAAKWFRRAAEQGNAPAQQNLGELYQNGMGVPRDREEALKWYRKAAEQGNGLAEYKMGAAYAQGAGVPLDFAQARGWYEKAATHNNADALNEIGIIYAKGQGVTTDYVEAAKWFRRAADKGVAIGAKNLAVFYAAGTGVPQDQLAAYFWYNFAAIRTTDQTQKTAATTARDAVATKLSSAQIERANAVARTWKAGMDVDTELHGAGNTQVATTGGAAPKTPSGPSSGTGIAISKSGHVLTNFHVVNGCKEIRAHAPGERAIVAELVAKDALNDLAVVKLASPLARSATFRAGQPLRQGDAVVVYGFPYGEVLAADGNLTTGNISALSGLLNDSRHLQISAPVQPGNSGGPLVDMSGNVIGVVVAKLNALAMMKFTGDVPQNVNFAIKTGVAESFLEANGIEYQTAPSAAQLQLPDVGERVKRITLRIDCSR